VLPFGQAISRTTYATLFSLISTTFGIGDGTTTFNVPDMRGKAVFGLTNMGGSSNGSITVAGGNFDGTTLGNSGGGQNKVIANGNLPADIPYTDPGHFHNSGGIGNFVLSASGSQSLNGTGGTIGQELNTASATTAITINHGGANTALPIMPPAIVLPYILRII
jgi:microcystin-dependent protein